MYLYIWLPINKLLIWNIHVSPTMKWKIGWSMNGHHAVREHRRQNDGCENPGESAYTHELRTHTSILSTVHSKRTESNNERPQINIGRANIGDDITRERWQTRLTDGGTWEFENFRPSAHTRAVSGIVGKRSRPLLDDCRNHTPSTHKLWRDNDNVNDNDNVTLVNNCEWGMHKQVV